MADIPPTPYPLSPTPFLLVSSHAPSLLLLLVSPLSPCLASPFPPDLLVAAYLPPCPSSYYFTPLTSLASLPLRFLSVFLPIAVHAITVFLTRSVSRPRSPFLYTTSVCALWSLHSFAVPILVAYTRDKADHFTRLPRP